MALYKGFSSRTKNNKFRLTDFELIKQDLYNHLFTRPGERLMNTTFGCIVWNLLYEPLTPAVKIAITENLTTIIKSEPRVRATDIAITEYENGLIIELELQYLQTNELDKMRLQFDRKSK